MELKIIDHNIEAEKERMEKVRQNVTRFSKMILKLVNTEVEEEKKPLEELLQHIQLIKGEKGDKGDIGEKGEIGLQGEQGIQGIQGKKGEMGPMGIQGLPGIPGEKGEVGKDGKDGKDGKHGTTAKEVVKYLKALPEKDKLEIKDLRNSQQLLAALGKLNNNQYLHGGGIVTVQNTGTEVTHNATVLNFTGSGISSITESQGIVTVNIPGSSGGITRSVNSVSSPTTAGATANTDYIYFVSGTTTLTLPTAVGNTNLYTVKNVGSNTVSVATTGGQTIDGSASPITIPVSETSLSFISDNSNWNIV